MSLVRSKSAIIYIITEMPKFHVQSCTIRKIDKVYWVALRSMKARMVYLQGTKRTTFIVAVKLQANTQSTCRWFTRDLATTMTTTYGLWITCNAVKIGTNGKNWRLKLSARATQTSQLETYRYRAGRTPRTTCMAGMSKIAPVKFRLNRFRGFEPHHP